MNKRVSILGCGWLGMALALDLSQKGNEIKASNTSCRKIKKLKSEGVIPFTIIINKTDYDISDFLSSEVLVISIPSKNVENFKNLICKIEKSKLYLTKIQQMNIK